MANHLRELIEDICTGKVMCMSGISDAIEDEVMRRVPSLSASAICFDGGNIKNMSNFKPIKEISTPPFNTCWLEFSYEKEADDRVVLGMIVGDLKPGISAFCFTKKTNQWMFVCYFSADGEKLKAIGDSEQSDVGKTAQEFASLARTFFTAINCTNIRRVEHNPDAKLQKARAKRGKQPLFSYWTLELDLDRTERGESLGGTHASPRLHLRRGHARQYAPGKWTWIQPFAVGNKKLGMVHKDYELVT